MLLLTHIQPATQPVFVHLAHKVVVVNVTHVVRMTDESAIEIDRDAGIRLDP
jgi:hypothetical protein